MKLLILTTTYDHHDKIWKRICDMGFVFDSVGTEYNPALGLELYRTFKPDLVILNAALTSIPFPEYIDLCYSYYAGAKFLIILPENEIHNKTYSPAILDYMTFHQLYTDTFPALLRKARFVIEKPAAVHSSSDTSGQYRIIIPKPDITVQFIDSRQFMDELKTILNQYCTNEIYPKGNHVLIKSLSGYAPDASFDNMLQEIQNLYIQNANAHVTFLILDAVCGQASDATRQAALITGAYELSYFCAEQKKIDIRTFTPKVQPARPDLPHLVETTYSLFVNHPDILYSTIGNYYKSDLKASFDTISCGKVHASLASLYLSLSAISGIPDDSLFTVYESLEEEARCISMQFLYLRKKCGPALKDANPILLKSLIYIAAHYHENISLKKAAEYCSTSETYISYLFKNKFIYKFSDYINHIRIKTAVLLLNLKPAGKISSIALDSGFTDYHYFSQLFKKSTGKTVSEYKATEIRQWGIKD